MMATLLVLHFAKNLLQWWLFIHSTELIHATNRPGEVL